MKLKQTKVYVSQSFLFLFYYDKSLIPEGET